MNHAGFWLRFVAFVIDTIILGIIGSLIITPILSVIGVAQYLSISDITELMRIQDIEIMLDTVFKTLGITYYVKLVFDILYHVFLESSKYQGSFGKMMLNLIVVDANGQKLTFSKALVRNASKIISGAILGIGYIIAGFTEKKQSLHDIIASTLVIKKDIYTQA